MIVMPSSCALVSLLDGSSPTRRKLVCFDRASVTNAPCLVSTSAIIFLGSANVPVMQNIVPVSFPFNVLLFAKLFRCTHFSLMRSIIAWLLGLENHSFSDPIISGQMPLIVFKNSSSQRNLVSVTIVKSSLFLFV